MKQLFKFGCLFLSVLFGLFFVAPVPVKASGNSFVSIVNPVRGNDFWSLPDQTPADAIRGESDILKAKSLPATWLVRFDALGNSDVFQVLENLPGSDEKGLLLEVTPSWAKAAGVSYRKSATWHMAGSIFLTGYEPAEREKLIDTAFLKFKQTFGFYPRTVGAWYLDSYSLNYMQHSYGVTGALIVADQYTTDNYQIWGQYWATPYYPSVKNTLIPAQTADNKIPIVITQWAARDPLNGYGDGVEESTYSVQANDYLDYHNLTTDYFSKLMDIYTQQKFNQFNQLVVGLENSYDWSKYRDEYARQMTLVAQREQRGQLEVVTLSGFSAWYENRFPDISPPQLIVASDPLGTNQRVVWFMDPYYRAGWFYNQEGSAFRDIRQYVQGQTEPCFSVSCSKLDFATFPTRVLDDVTYNQRLVLDQGGISDFQIKPQGEGFLLSYKNAAGTKKLIQFLPRDISIDGRTSSIDGLILRTISSQSNQTGALTGTSMFLAGEYRDTLLSFSLKILRFLTFAIFGLFIPGFILTKNMRTDSIAAGMFLAVCNGMVMLTLAAWVAGLLHVFWLVWVYLIISAVFFVVGRYYPEIHLKKLRFRPSNVNLAAGVIIILGIVFQSSALVRSGWVYDFGLGFWGPLGHDGIWHQALINQLLQNVPPQNPGFAGTTLDNYHYFFDLLVAVTTRISAVPVLDLLYRFYPVLFSSLLGIGTYLLSGRLFKDRMAALFALYFVYFAGSFGWIVEFLRERHFGGESAFWINQPVSMNLNPPFAISLALMIAILLGFSFLNENKKLSTYLLLAVLAGSLIEYKVYAGIIVLGGLLLLCLQEWILHKDGSLLKLFIPSLILSLVVFLPQNSHSGSLIVLSPFWFIHSMIDFPDRVGWLRLSQARQAYQARGDWLKFLLAEGLGLFLFIAGNLGTRFIALGVVRNLKDKIQKNPGFGLIFWMSLLSFFIPIIFIQQGNPWNTIQFSYYLLYFSALVAGLVVIALYRKSAKLKLFFKVPALIFLSAWILITPINAVTTFSSSLSAHPPSCLPWGEYQALGFLRGLPQAVVLTYPYDSKLKSTLPEPFPLFAYETSSYVSAFSGKPVFLEDEIQQEILQNNVDKRLTAADDFFKGANLVWSKEFLADNNIRYIYLPKVFILPADAGQLNIKNIYENKEVVIYEVIK